MASSFTSRRLRPTVSVLLCVVGVGCGGAEEGTTWSSGGGGSIDVAGSGAGGSNASVGGADAGGAARGGSDSSGAAAGSASSGGVATGGAASSSELPCEVQTLLAQKCLACHQAEPPGKLLTSADFHRASRSDPQRTVGEVALERLGATGASRMPPAPLPAATADEIAALTSWVKGGAMASTCDNTVPVPPNPYDTPLVCTSMTRWTGGNRESPLMHPGRACISCHQSEGEGPLFAIAGTLYPTAHEPDDCNGVASALGAKVIVTDANGMSQTLTVNAAGNFFLETRNLALPYQAKVVYQGKERVMLEAQQNGDCNDCHTQDGRNKAPGRIFLP